MTVSQRIFVFTATLRSAVFIFLLSACSSQPQKESSPAEGPKPEQISLQTSIGQDELNQLVLGNIAYDREQYEQASEQLIPLAQSSKNPEIIKKAYASAVKAKDRQAALQMAELLAEQSPTDPSTLSLLIIAQIHALKIDIAAQTLKQLIGREEIEEELHDKLSIIVRATPQASLEATIANIDTNARPSLSLLAARVFQQKKSLLQALNISNRLAKEHPDFIPGGLFHIELLVSSRQMEAAINAAKLLIKKSPNDRYRLQLANLYYQSHQYELAIEHYKRLLIANPVDKVAMYGLGACYYLTEQFDKSIEIYRQLSPMEYRSDIVNFFLAEMYREKHMVEEAIEYYAKIDTGRYYGEAKIKIAELLKETQSIYQAIEFLENASAQDPERSHLWANTLADYLISINQVDQALSLINKQLQQAPENKSLLLSKVELTLRLNPENLNNLLDELAPQKFVVESERFVLAVAFLLRENQLIPDAVNWLGKIIKKNPYQTELYYNRALIASEIEDYQTTIDDLRKLLNIKSNHYEAMNALGYTLADINQDLDEAFYLISEAVRHNPNNAAMHDSLGWIYYRIGEFDNAEEELRKALKLDYQGDVAAHLSEVLFESQKSKEAAKILKKALHDFPKNSLLNAVKSKYLD